MRNPKKGRARSKLPGFDGGVIQRTYATGNHKKCKNKGKILNSDWKKKLFPPRTGGERGVPRRGSKGILALVVGEGKKP